jgi:hypothetical protein
MSQTLADRPTHYFRMEQEDGIVRGEVELEDVLAKLASGEIFRSTNGAF